MSEVMVFRAQEKEYCGSSALEIVQALKREAAPDGGLTQPVRQFLLESLGQFRDHIPLRDLDVSDRLSDEMLALSYLYLRDEFGAGELRGLPNRQSWAKPL
ncbi:MAG: hypothetical protein LC802_24190 [Acidobacteria bacterium]|nr:hypothetical protein [Acidobacteriota bacterium]